MLVRRLRDAAAGLLDTAVAAPGTAARASGVAARASGVAARASGRAARTAASKTRASISSARTSALAAAGLVSGAVVRGSASAVRGPASAVRTSAAVAAGLTSVSAGPMSGRAGSAPRTAVRGSAAPIRGVAARASGSAGHVAAATTAAAVGAATAAGGAAVRVAAGGAGAAARMAAGTAGAAVRTAGAAARAPGAVVRVTGDEARAVVGALDRRRVHRADGRTSFRVRGIHRPGSEDMCADLARELLDVAGVARAEVNAVLGLVMVVHGDDVPVDALMDLVEKFEDRHGIAGEPFARHADPIHRPAVAREIALAAAYLVGGGAAIAGTLVRRRAAPPAVGTVMAMIDATPQIRDLLSQRIGPTATDLLLGGGNASLQALAQQPTGLLIGSLHRFIRLGEMRGHHDAWRRRAAHLVERDGSFHAPALDVPARPVPLPYGPVERAAWTVPAALTAAAGTYLGTRNAQRAQGVLAAGVPRAARLGREAFTIQLGRLAARRDAVVLDPERLRRLDRVDQVIVDVSALRTGELVIEEVVTVSAAVTVEEAYERAHALVDLAQPGTRRTGDGGWAVAPFRRSRAGADRRLPAEARARAAELHDRGATVLLLTRGGEPAALVSVVPELDPLAEELIVVARRAGSVLVAGAAAVARRLSADGAVAGGGRLLESVRRCQEEGHVVALVSAHGGASLAAADVGIGLLHAGHRPPWGAHVLCGPGLAEACQLLGAVGPARAVSVRAAQIAAVGSVSGLLLAAAGPAAGAARRAQLAVDAAALSAFAAGTWSGLTLARRPGPVPTDRTPWHAWPVRAVLDRLGSSAAGIDAAEAARRRAVRGDEPRPPGLAEVTVQELGNPLTPALAAGAGVSAVVGSIIDATLIATVLGVNALMVAAQRVRADRALHRLVDLSAIRVRLRRPAAEGQEPGEDRATADELAPGDVVMLTAGDAVPADLRLLSAKGLEVDESSLTGESQLVAKSPRPSAAEFVADRHSMLYEGTVVAAGEAVGVVVATGAQTEVGRTTRVAGEERPEGGVEKRLRALTEVTLPIALGAGVLLFVSDLLRGQPMARALGPAISLAVAAVPEGLPFVATAAELATARRMSRRGTLVRNPMTIEALGRIDVLCFDKTGTLTEGRLRLREVSDGVSSFPIGDLPAAGREIVAAAIRATPDRGGRRLPHPTDRAIMRAARKLGMDASEGLGSWERVDELPFEPGRGYHAVLGRSGGRQRLSVKGAPEIVLDRCREWRTGEGLVRFDAAARERVDREVDRLARRGYRVLAVAERTASGRRDLTESRIDRLCLLGLACIADPVRPTAAEAVRRLRRAGVDVVMITGDHPTTAEAIAAELRLLNGRIMTGADLDALQDADLAGAIAGVSVFARVSPVQKARVVKALRDAGRVVAVTGDGANDAPAIRLADVGIALGERATPAARETADVVVTDDRIETITDAIADCRAMWRSTRDALAVLLGGNLGEIAFTLGTGLISGRSPLGVRQLLLVNLLTDMLPAIALAARPPSGITHEELLAEGPDRSLGGALTRDVTARAGTTAAAALVAWLLARASGTRGQADTTGLVALVATQLAQTIAAGGRDLVVLGSGAASLAALGIIVQTPGVSHFFGCRPLLPHCWIVALGSAGAFALAAVVLTRVAAGRREIASADNVTWADVHPDVTSDGAEQPDEQA